MDHATKITLIQSYSADRRRLLELEGRQRVATERSRLAEAQLGEIRALDGELATRLKAYREGMNKRLKHEITEAEVESKGCLAEAAHRRDIGQRMSGLAKSGTTSQIRSAEALAKQEETTTRCRTAEARAERLKTELVSLQAGVLLRDAANDVPYSQQQRERLTLRRLELEAEAGQQSVLAEELNAEIAEERSRVGRLGQYDVTLPKDFVVWSVPASPGSIVSQGQTVLDLAACDHRFVAVEVPEREFENIKPSDPAQIRLIGSSNWREGFVRQIRGSAARADDRLLAAQVPIASSGKILVEISLPDDGIQPSQSSYCNIGRLAEVRFQRKAPAFMQTFRNFINRFASRSTSPTKIASG